MLDSLKDSVKRFLSGSTPYDKAVEAFIKELQKSLITSDVKVSLVSELTQRIKKRLEGEQPPSYVDRREWFLKIVYDELSAIFGGDSTPDLLPSKIPYIMMLVGVQGTGKTTTAGKLAYYYKRKGYKVGLVGADVYRPAALEQLMQLGKQTGIEVYGEPENKDPVSIAKRGVDYFLKSKAQIIIVDTAGRHGYGEEQSLLDEMKSISQAINPDEVVLVIDASIGQKAYDLASRFHAATPVGSLIITKMDGTAKGGGALSAAAATGARIKFIGTGEKLDELEPFNPRRFVSRILGRGDIEAIIEKLSSIEEYEEIQEKMEEVMSGKGNITLREMYKQFKAVKKMGPLSKVIQLIPGMSLLPKTPSDEELKITEKKMERWMAILNSMTYEELDDPSVIDRSRTRRIAKGAGVQPEEVRELLKQYEMTQKFIKMIRKRKDLGKLIGKE